MKVKRIPVLPEHSRVYELLGVMIAEARGAKNLSQRELAHIVGLSRSSINSVERGQQHLLAGDLILISRVLEIRLDKLELPGFSNRRIRTWARKRLNSYYLEADNEKAA